MPVLLRAVEGELDKEAASLALTGAAETLRAVCIFTFSFI